MSVFLPKESEQGRAEKFPFDIHNCAYYGSISSHYKGKITQEIILKPDIAGRNSLNLAAKNYKLSYFPKEYLTLDNLQKSSRNRKVLEEFTLQENIEAIAQALSSEELHIMLKEEGYEMGAVNKIKIKVCGFQYLIWMGVNIPIQFFTTRNLLIKTKHKENEIETTHPIVDEYLERTDVISKGSIRIPTKVLARIWKQISEENRKAIQKIFPECYSEIMQEAKMNKRRLEIGSKNYIQIS